MDTNQVVNKTWASLYKQRPRPAVLISPSFHYLLLRTCASAPAPPLVTDTPLHARNLHAGLLSARLQPEPLLILQADVEVVHDHGRTNSTCYVRLRQRWNHLISGCGHAGGQGWATFVGVNGRQNLPARMSTRPCLRSYMHGGCGERASGFCPGFHYYYNTCLSAAPGIACLRCQKELVSFAAGERGMAGVP